MTRVRERFLHQYMSRPTYGTVCGCIPLAAAAIICSFLFLCNPLIIFAAFGCCGYERLGLGSAKWAFFIHLLFVLTLIPASVVLICYFVIHAVQTGNLVQLLGCLATPCFLAIEMKVLELLRCFYRVLKAGGTGWERCSAEAMDRDAERSLFYGNSLILRHASSSGVEDYMSRSLTEQDSILFPPSPSDLASAQSSPVITKKA